MLPPRDFDVREYHLQVPKEWYQQGRIDFVPHNVYGNMPLGAEMHALLAMVLMPGPIGWWWGALVGKTVIACFVPLATLALFSAGCRLVSVPAGFVAALVFISVPWMAYVSMAGLIDGAVACYLLLSLYALLIWCQQRFGNRLYPWSASERAESDEAAAARGHSSFMGVLALSGFLAGSAVACKYPALLFVALPLTVLVVLLSRSWKAVAVFLIAIACASGLWFGKNWMLAHNPTYPLLNNVFGGRDWNQAKDRQWRDAHAVPRDEQGRRYSLASAVDAAEEVTLSSRWMSPLLVPFAVLALLVRRQRRLVVILFAIYLFILTTWWLATHRIERFWIPAVPLLALLAGIGAVWTDARRWFYFAGVVLLFGTVNNLLLIASPAIGDVRILVSLDELRSEIHPAHYYLNQAVPEGTQALLVGDAQPFDLDVPVSYNTCFDDCLLEKLLKGRSTQDRKEALRQHSISFVFVDWNELARYRGAGNYGYAAGSDFVQPRLFDELVQQRLLAEPVDLPTAPVANSGYPPPQIYRVIAEGL